MKVPIYRRILLRKNIDLISSKITPVISKILCCMRVNSPNQNEVLEVEGKENSWNFRGRDIFRDFPVIVLAGLEDEHAKRVRVEAGDMLKSGQKRNYWYLHHRGEIRHDFFCKRKRKLCSKVSKI